jgi:hypothetical protein
MCFGGTHCEHLARECHTFASQQREKETQHPETGYAKRQLGRPSQFVLLRELWVALAAAIRVEQRFAGRMRFCVSAFLRM